MTQINLNESSHQEEEQEQSHLPPPTPPTETSSFPCPILFHTPQGHGATDREQHHLYQHKPQEASELSSTGKSSPHDHSLPFQSSEQYSPFDRYAGEKRSHGSVMQRSKSMQLMRKMMGSSDLALSSTPIKMMGAPQDHRQLRIHDSCNSSSGSSNNDSIIRACSDCNTMKTPLWRSGPRGPKSLCNACGIRQRKARRAAAAAAATGESIVGDTVASEAQREKRSDGDRTVPYKKRWKFTARSEIN